MGTVIYDKDGFQVKRFYGGDERGVCFQLTTKGGFIQVPRDHFYRMLIALTLEAILKIPWRDLDNLRDVETCNVKLWCPQIKDLITLCIETADKDSAIVKGKPFGCNLQNCSRGKWCLLTIERIEVHT